MGEALNLGSGTESTIVLDIAFWVISVSTIIAGLAVVFMKDVFRAALFLVVAFLGTAGLFVLLRAEFLAVVQVIIYVGAISVLILFAILMTRDTEQGSPSTRLRYPAGGVALLFRGAAIFVSFNSDWVLLTEFLQGGVGETPGLSEATVAKVNEVYADTVPVIASLLLRDYVLAFEVVSVLLLAAVIGALALVRER